MPNLDKIIKIAKEAGEIMLSASHIETSVDSKEGYQNFVTEYDRRIQEFLFEELKKAEPEAHFLGEEEGAEQFLPEYEKGILFVIDPIDGTSNFIEGYNLSVVSIGILKDGKPFQGVVYNPYARECFSAEAGKGAFCNGKRIQSSDKSLMDSLVIIGTSPYYKELEDEVFRIGRYYFDRCIDLRRSGSAAWDLCCLASGRAGLYFELRLGFWDYAAGALILSEAGGVCTDIEGQEISYRGPSSMLAVSRGIKDSDYFPNLPA